MAKVCSRDCKAFVDVEATFSTYARTGSTEGVYGIVSPDGERSIHNSF